MHEKFVICVDDAPPAKDGGLSIRNPRHGDHAKVISLREQMRLVMTGRTPIGGVPLRMDVHYCRANSRADALNIINGISDVIQSRCDVEAYRCEVSVIDDDAFVREFHYTEEKADQDHYRVTIRPLG